MRPQVITIVLAAVASLAMAGCSTAGGTAPAGSVGRDAVERREPRTAHAAVPPMSDGDGQTTYAQTLSIQVGEDILIARLEDNSSAVALGELLSDGPLTLDLHDYGGFEKVGPLPQALPTNDYRITTEPGDITLYQGDQVSLYYDTNTWSLTRLARIVSVSGAELRDILGEGDVTITLSLGD